MTKLLTTGLLSAFLATPVLADNHAYSYSGPSISGDVVTIAGPWLGSEETHFEEVIAAFEAATGADVQYAGSDSFEQQIVIDVQAGSPPNIAAFPQPGLAANLAAQGALVSLGNDTANWVRDNYAAGSSWVDLGTYANENGADEFYGFFYNVNVKSLVWYVPENFEDAGYDIPGTMDELINLTEQMASDGNTPWCIGLGSGDATGWPATDWVEDIMLRTQPASVYDRWVTNEMPFTDDSVVSAIKLFGQFARNPRYVDGGGAAVGSVDFRDSPKGLFSVPPKCFMHRQASFIPNFFPDDVEVGEDADFFYFPGYGAEKPVLGGGILMAITADSAATRAFIEYLKDPMAHELWMARDGFLTPHTGVDLAKYSSDTLRKQGQILFNATTFRFDGSDLMPGAIGAGSFWTGMVDYVSGASAESVASGIQRSWDAIK